MSHTALIEFDQNLWGRCFPHWVCFSTRIKSFPPLHVESTRIHLWLANVLFLQDSEGKLNFSCEESLPDATLEQSHTFCVAEGNFSLEGEGLNTDLLSRSARQEASLPSVWRQSVAQPDFPGYCEVSPLSSPSLLYSQLSLFSTDPPPHVHNVCNYCLLLFSFTLLVFLIFSLQLHMKWKHFLNIFLHWLRLNNQVIVLSLKHHYVRTGSFCYLPPGYSHHSLTACTYPSYLKAESSPGFDSSLAPLLHVGNPQFTE